MRRLLPLWIFLFALLLRLIGIGWGLGPFTWASYHPDEAEVYRQATSGIYFVPGQYNYGTLYLTVLRLANDVLAVYGGAPPPHVVQAGLYGLLENPAAMDQVWGHVDRVHLAGRIISAVAGAGTAVVVFLMMRRFVALLGAAAASLVVAVAPAHVVHSRFQAVDVLATFLLALSLLYALRILPGAVDEEREWPAARVAALAGLFAGLSMSTKYTGILGLLTLWAALTLAKPHRWAIAGLFGTACAIGAFLLTTPGVLVDTERFLRDVRYEMLHTATGHGLVFAGTSSGYVYHLSNLIIGIGGLLFLLSISGLAVACWTRQWWALSLLAMVLPYYLVVGRAEVKFIRYTFPIYLGLAAGFGWLMAESHRRKGWAKGVVALGIAGLGGLDPGGLRSAAEFTGAMVQPDARDLAASFLRKQGAATVGVVTDPWFYTPAFQKWTTLPRSVPLERRLAFMRESKDPSVVQAVPEDPVGRRDWDERLVTHHRPDFITYSSFETKDLERLSSLSGLSPDVQAMVTSWKQFHNALRREYELLVLYGPGRATVHDLEYVRPSIWIWKRRDL